VAEGPVECGFHRLGRSEVHVPPARPRCRLRGER
jgi:hypothetical protein